MNSRVLLIGLKVFLVGVEQRVPDQGEATEVTHVFRVVEVVVGSITTEWQESEYRPWELVARVSIGCLKESEVRPQEDN